MSVCPYASPPPGIWQPAQVLRHKSALPPMEEREVRIQQLSGLCRQESREKMIAMYPNEDSSVFVYVWSGAANVVASDTTNSLPYWHLALDTKISVQNNTTYKHVKFMFWNAHLCCMVNHPLQTFLHNMFSLFFRVV